MTTTHPDPHTCPARGVELRTADEIEAERQHYRMRCEKLWPGYALVPVVPTERMLCALNDAAIDIVMMRHAADIKMRLADGYASMLAAAQTSPD